MQGHARVALYSCLVNGLLVGIKYCLWLISGSLALKADAIHSLADVISALTIFAGIIIADRKTKAFPEGLYKVENLGALVSSLFILYAAYEIGRESLTGHSVAQIHNLPMVVAGIFAIILITFLFSRYELKIGLEVGSPSLVADAKHIVTDLLSTLVILVGVLGSFFGYHLDRYAALVVAVLVGRMGFHILVDSLRVLLDATLDYPTLDGIRKVLEDHPNVKEVIAVGGRSSGRYKFVEIAVSVNVKLLREAHQVISYLEEEILDRWPDIDKILVHYEPEQKKTWRVAVPIDVVKGEGPHQGARLSDHFGEAPYFAFLSQDRLTGHVTVERYLENSFRDLDRQKGVRAAELLADHGVDEITTRVDLAGKGSGYAIEALQIVYSVTSAQTLAELIANMGKEA